MPKQNKNEADNTRHSVESFAKFLIPPQKKGNSHECVSGLKLLACNTDVKTENTAPKAGANSVPEAGKSPTSDVRTGLMRGRTLAHTRSYLAINWQRTGRHVRFTSADRRFPTPQSTINDVCDLERSALSCRSCNRRRLHLKLSGPARGRGGGGSRDAKAETVVTVQSRGIFGAKGADTVFLFKKNSARNGGRSTKAAAQQFCWACAMSSQHHHEHQSLN